MKRTLFLLATILSFTVSGIAQNESGISGEVKSHIDKESLYSCLSGHLSYPMRSVDLKRSGFVLAKFNIDESGAVTDVTILQSPHMSLSLEVNRVLQQHLNGCLPKNVLACESYYIGFDFILKDKNGNRIEPQSLPADDYRSLDILNVVNIEKTVTAEEYYTPKSEARTYNKAQKLIVSCSYNPYFVLGDSVYEDESIYIARREALRKAEIRNRLVEAVKNDSARMANGVGSRIIREAEDYDHIYEVVESKAQYKGDSAALNNFFSKSIKMPRHLRKQDWEWRAEVIFEVDKDGSLQNIEMNRCVLRRYNNVSYSQAKEIHNRCLEQVFKSISQMPRWTPAKHGDIPYRSQMHMTISVRIGEVYPPSTYYPFWFKQKPIKAERLLSGKY